MYQLFQESGELEVRIRRIGAGPNGETIYFDSENAIHLYNFNHGLPAPDAKNMSISVARTVANR